MNAAASSSARRPSGIGNTGQTCIMFGYSRSVTSPATAASRFASEFRMSHVPVKTIVGGSPACSPNRGLTRGSLVATSLAHVRTFSPAVFGRQRIDRSYQLCTRSGDHAPDQAPVRILQVEHVTAAV